MLVRNVPIRCQSCSGTVYGREQSVTESSGKKVMNCTWRCTNCGSFCKQGVTQILSEPSHKL